MPIRAYGKSVESYDAWVTNTEYELEDYRIPTTDNGLCYECTTAGTSDSSETPVEPTWPTIVTETVADGTVVWTCREKAEVPAALSVTLFGKGVGLPRKDVWFKSDGSVTFLIEVSYTGADGTWRELDSVNINDTEKLKQYVTSFSHIRVSTETVATNEIEIVKGM